MGFHPAIEFYQKYGAPLAGPKVERSDLARLFVRAANKTYMESKEFEELQKQIDDRQRRLAEGSLIAELKARLVIGMSHGRLWGNGFQFHPEYGVPYLPGSGIKGALRHFLVEQGKTEDEVRSWFGFEDQQASVTLFDAYVFPGKKKLLSEEILNKHHKDYYEPEAGGKIQPPADYNQPVPVKFVAVAAGVKFRFVYGVLEGGPTLEELRVALVECLDLAGMGAKTRKGFGRMVPSK